MKTFILTWLVHYFDDDVYYTVEQEFSSENLDKLFDDVDSGLEEDKYSPELEVPTNYGDFNIEYVKIINKETKEILYLDKDFDQSKVKEHFN